MTSPYPHNPDNQAAEPSPPQPPMGTWYGEPTTSPMAVAAYQDGGIAPPPKKSRRTLWIVMGAVGGLVLLCCGGLVVIGSLAPPVKKAASTSETSPADTGILQPAPTATSPVPSPVPSPVASPVASVTAAKTTAAAVATTTLAVQPPAPPPPPPPPPPAAPTCGAPPNPYGFNFCGRGSNVYKAGLPNDVCSYFSCIANFYNGNGYMVECADGMYSMSGGIQGVCSKHQGQLQAVFRG